MSISDSNAIFHRSDSQEILNYLNLRLKAGDLSDEEALAILSAVHAELGKGSSTDPRVYRLYNYTLKSLQQAMPSVYDYIVATWFQRHDNNLNVPDDEGSITNGDVPPENKSQTVEVERKEGLYGIKSLEEELERTDDKEGPEEEEKETDAVEEKDVEPEKEETEQEIDQEAEEGSEEDRIKLEEDQHEKNQEPDDDIDNESLQETDIDEPGKEGGSENESSVEDNENEADEEFIGEEIVNESPGGTEKLETEGESGKDQGEEMEWPEIEQSLPEDQIEGSEGRETSTEPED